MKTTATKKPFVLLYSIFSFALSLVAPPRPTEEVVGNLSLEHLIYLANTDGSLPYHRPEVTALVWEIKYRANSSALRLAGEYLADLVLAEAAEEIGRPLLVPIPMHAARRHERGHNQTELLCEAAFSFFAPDTIEYAPRALEKIRATTAQQGLARHKRLNNIKNSMRASPSLVKGRVCIVVDDVSTTGATCAEARRALLSAGARKVTFIALARS